MTRRFCAVLLSAMVIACCGASHAADAKDAMAIVDKGIKAIGGEEKLGKAPIVSWRSKGKFLFGDNESPFTVEGTAQGLDKIRQEFEGEFGGNKVQGIVVVNGDKGWRRFGDMSGQLDKEALANEKRRLQLQLIPATLVPLKDKQFKLDAAGEQIVGGKPAAVVKATGPDGKEFTVYFDRESGLPVKQVANVIGFMGEEYKQESTYADYMDFGGIKKATKIESKRDGEKFFEQEVTDFKLLDKVDDEKFAEPK